METLILNKLYSRILTSMSIFLFLNAQARARLLYVSLAVHLTHYKSSTSTTAIDNTENVCIAQAIQQILRRTTATILTTARCHLSPRYRIIRSQITKHYDKFLNLNIQA
jgi:hypothetical protein